MSQRKLRFFFATIIYLVIVTVIFFHGYKFSGWIGGLLLFFLAFGIHALTDLGLDLIKSRKKKETDTNV